MRRECTPAPRKWAPVDKPLGVLFGVGHDVNTKLLDKIAAQSHGARDYVRENESIEMKTGALFTKLNHPVMSNVHLRRAIALSIDHTWVIDNLYSEQAIMARSVIPPGVSGFDPDYHPYHSDDGTVRDHDYELPSSPYSPS